MTATARRVLVTRAPGAWPALAARGWVFRAPTLALPPVDPAPLANAVAGVDRFDWIVFTSVTGVERLASALRATGHGPGALVAKAACVGPATARAAESEGWHAAVVAPEGTGRSLAREIVDRATPGERVLVVRPESGSAFPVALLERAALAVTGAAAYRTAAAPEAAAIARDLARGAYDAIVLTAPSALDAILAAPDGREGLLAVRRAAIGGTTAAALERASLPAGAVASEPTEAAVGDAVDSLW